MPHANLYGVTSTLRELLRINIWRITGLDVTVTDLPPEEAEKESGSRLNLHLYHAVETPYLRNEFPIDDAGPHPISRTPMPLTLYYALTAHVVIDSLVSIKSQQKLMGLGMKSLHDFPVIDEQLKMPNPTAPHNPVQILDTDLRGGHNRIEIAPRPVTPEEALSFWSSAQNHTARLTAYYEVRSTLLFPDEGAEKPGIVTAFALGVGSSARPTLSASSSVQTVKLPALSGGMVLSTNVSPGVAALGAVSPPAGNHAVVSGEALGDGTDAKLVLSSSLLAALSPPVDDAVIDPASNPAWKFLFAGDRVEFDVLKEVNIEAPGGFRTVTIRPGLYSVGVLRERQLVTSAGATTSSTVESNRISLSVGPRVSSVGVTAGKIVVNLPTHSVDCTDPLNKLQLAIAGEVYSKVTSFTGDPTKDPGTFIATTSKITAAPLFDPTDGATRMVRFSANGVDAQPVWLEP